MAVAAAASMRFLAALLAALVAALALVSGASARQLHTRINTTPLRPMAGPRVTNVNATPYVPGGPTVTTTNTRATPFRPVAGPQTTTVAATPGRPLMGPAVVRTGK